MNARRILQTLHPPYLQYSSSQSPAIRYADISHILSICGRQGNLHLGSSLHAYLIKHPQFFNLKNQQFGNDNTRNALIVWNSLLSMYCKCGKLSDAVKLFDNILVIKDTVSWNSIISGFLRNGDFKMGFGYFKMMLDSGNYQFDEAARVQNVYESFSYSTHNRSFMQRTDLYRFDHASLTTILSACDGVDFIVISKMVHGLVILSGYQEEITVRNALITAYFRCRCSYSGRRVFDEMVERNVITWTAVITGLANCQLHEESFNLFRNMYSGPVVPNNLTYLGALLACSGLQTLKEGRQIHGIVCKLGIHSDFCIESALMDMYSKCGSLDDAWWIFKSAEVIDEVSMTVILAGFAQNGCEEEAIDIFVKMVKAGVEIDPNMISAVLGVFGMDTSLGLGKQVHSLVIKKGFVSNPFVSNGLINMYSKCGDLDDSIKVFDRIPLRNAISWNSIIAAFARHGNGFRALQLYEEMRAEGIEPTDVTFLSLLHACSHVGLVEKGMEFLEFMEKVYGLKPRMEHYACIVDLLGRAGLLNEAKSFIQNLPVEPDVLVWQALLGGCGIHGDTEMGKYAADQLLLAAPDSPVPYVTMANIYSSRGRWKERARMIKKMKEVGVTKETGVSWIEIEKEVHSFVVADQMHPQRNSIYITLLKLFRHMRDEGYVPDKRFSLFYMDQDENEYSPIDVQDRCNLYVECMN